MITMIQNWKGKVAVNGVEYNTVQDAISRFKPSKGEICIKLFPERETPLKNENMRSETGSRENEVRITVKKYMTEKATPQFDFMAKWNNDVPMPLRTMTGKVIKETRGMVQMELHGDIWAQKIATCMCCGRKLTNPVSQYFGIGPECGGHNYINPFDSDEELKEAVAEYRKKLQAVKWTGWIIKSAITEEVEV